MHKKRAIIGFKDCLLMPVTKNDLMGYAAQEAQGGDTILHLHWAGQMTKTPKESTQDLNYDDALYASIRVYDGDEIEMRFAEMPLSHLEKLGLGSWNPDTQTFEARGFTPLTGPFSVRFITETVDELAFFWKYRLLEINGARFDNFQTKGSGSVQVCEFIIQGIVKKPRYRHAGPFAVRQMADDRSNEEQCYAFITGEDVLPNPATTPDAPTITGVTAGSGSAAVAFTPPANDGGSAITGYLAIAQPGAGAEVTANGTASPITITGLTNGTEYSVTVIAQNDVGSGTPSAAQTVTPTA